jgi:SAM-dependent methyltransferase
VTATPTPDDDWSGGDRAARWLRQSAGLERQLAPVSDLLFAAAALQPGERVLDVGCGTGPTTRHAAVAVGSGGAVTGLDVAGGLLEAAASVPVDGDAAGIEWVEADAVSWTPPADGFDVVISRFGVMFFSDPAAAFANLAAATRPGGRLAVAVWAHRHHSPLFEVPLQAVLDVRRAHGLGEPAGLAPDGGPFSLGDVAATGALLVGAGWSDVDTREHDIDLLMAGGLDPEAAAAASTDFGPTRLALADLDADLEREAVAAVADRYGDHVDDHGRVVLAGRVIVVTARR